MYTYGCRFFGELFLFCFVFQSGALFLAICILEQKPVLYFAEIWSKQLPFALFIDVSMVSLAFSTVFIDLPKVFIDFP